MIANEADLSEMRQFRWLSIYKVESKTEHYLLSLVLLKKIDCMIFV